MPGRVRLSAARELGRRRCWLGLLRSKENQEGGYGADHAVQDRGRGRCTDGACGQVSRIIVNPAAQEVTHLVVDRKHRHGPGRLVPVDLVDATTGQIRLRCTLAKFQTLQPAQETESVPDLDPTGHGHPDNAPNKVNWAIVDGAVIMQPSRPGGPEAPQQVTVDYIPSGGVDIHRELTVCATDGEMGQVQGLVVEPGGHQVTHVLLQKGRMRGRKEVAIPIGAVTKIGTFFIHLSLTRDQVKDLPRVDIDHPAG